MLSLPPRQGAGLPARVRLPRMPIREAIQLAAALAARHGASLACADWRPLLRYEDSVLLRGRGRYTADLARGARRLRFVRSPVARGRILRVNAPREVPIITAAILGDVKPICPRLDRSDYVAVAQPILAYERVKYAGEPIACVVAAVLLAISSVAPAVDLASVSWAAAALARARATAARARARAAVAAWKRIVRPRDPP